MISTLGLFFMAPQSLHALPPPASLTTGFSDAICWSSDTGDVRHIVDLRFKHVALKDSYSLRTICPRPRLFRPVISSDRTAKVIISFMFFLTPILDRLVHFLPNLCILCLVEPLSIHFLFWKIRNFAPPWGTWLRTRYLREKKRRKQAQHPAGIESRTSRV